MCGIAGVIAAHPVDSGALLRMRDSMIHRGPDHGGSWINNDRCIALVHRRLKIIDLSPEANQPFVTSDGRFIVTFNGEIYNFRELRRELVARGGRMQTQSDTEVIVEAYRCWGAACLERLTGMFAFAIWDTVERRLFCARDRAGEKPLFYAMANGAFIFASELKALACYPGFRRSIDYTALLDYLVFGYVPDPKSIWQGCHKLPPGHSLTVDVPASGPTPRPPVQYWDMQFEPNTTERAWPERILDTLQGACRDMAFADVPLGAFLSGGVDSSSVTAGLSKAGCNVESFTVGFEEPEFDERPWAREVARLFSARHNERVVSAADAFAVFEKLLWHYDEPFNDYSSLPTYYLCRAARQRITVALSGDGADELFAGYSKYRRLGLRRMVERVLPRGVSGALIAGSRPLLGNTPWFQRKVEPYGRDASAVMLDMLTTSFSCEELKAAARGPLAHALKSYSPADTIAPLLSAAPPDEVGLINTMRYLDLKLTLAGDMLVKVDRASMAVSLEVRPVYLHRSMLDLASRIPCEMLADRQQSKKLLKSALRSWLPDALLYRPKMGFAAPLPKWINGELSHMVNRVRGNPLNDLIDPSLSTGILRSHKMGTPDLTSRIHSLLLLEHWLNRWN
jgi:asparagine synthase (glutamine-hydrolysing)